MSQKASDAADIVYGCMLKDRNIFSGASSLRLVAIVSSQEQASFSGKSLLLPVIAAKFTSPSGLLKIPKNFIYFVNLTIRTFFSNQVIPGALS